MKILICTGMGKSKSGDYYNLFPSGWSSKSRYHASTYYPYMLAHVSSLLKQNTDHEVKFLDGNFQGFTISKYTEVLVDEAPDLIVIESDSLTWPEDAEMLRAVKERIPVRVVCCGAYPTAEPALVLKECADHVVLGEFELVVLELVQSGFADDVKGVHPNGRAALVDPDVLPLPENDDIKRRNYGRIFGMEYREVEVIATRGCPYHCNFCVSRHVYDGRSNYRTRDPHKVAEEIAYLRREIPDLEGIFFNDRSHTIHKQFNMELCDAILEAGLGDLKYECLTNYSGLDEELLVRMLEAGYYKVRIGMETLDIPSAEKAFCRKGGKRDEEKMLSVLEICRRIGMKVYATLSVGTWGSTAESDMNTLRSIRELYEAGYLQEFQYSINTPMPGTPFHELVVKDGLIRTDDLDQYNGIRTSVLDFPDYASAEVEEVFRAFQAFGEEIIRRNKEKGVSYSAYDREWVKAILDVTPVAEQYT